MSSTVEGMIRGARARFLPRSEMDLGDTDHVYSPWNPGKYSKYVHIYTNRFEILRILAL